MRIIVRWGWQLVLVVFFLSFFGHAVPQNYPTRPIRLIVPFAPGGNTEIIARVVGQKMSGSLGEPLVVDSRPGGNANIGHLLAAKAAPDGYTLLMTTSALTTNLHLFKNVPYDPLKDFSPISFVANAPHVLVVHPSLAVNSLQDLVNLSKKRKLTYGSAGVGNATHFSMEILKIIAKIDILHVPYRGTGAALPALLGNHVQVEWASLSPLQPHINAGRLKALAVGSLKRLKAAPDIPTVAEQGYPGYQSGSWFGIVAPAGTPAGIVSRLNKEVNKALDKPEVNELLITQGNEPAGNTPKEFGNFIRKDIARWGELVKLVGIEPQ